MPFFMSVSGLWIPAQPWIYPSVQIQADVARHHGMAAGAEVLKVYGIGEEEPTDVGQKHILYFKGASGYLEGHPASPIQAEIPVKMIYV